MKNDDRERKEGERREGAVAKRETTEEPQTKRDDLGQETGVAKMAGSYREGQLEGRTAQHIGWRSLGYGVAG